MVILRCDLSNLQAKLFKNPSLTQGPLITDGRNSSKWTGHYVGWYTP